MKYPFRSLILLALLLTIPIPALQSRADAAPPSRSEPPAVFLPEQLPVGSGPAEPGVLRQQAVRVDFNVLDRSADAWKQGQRGTASHLQLNLFPGLAPVGVPEQIRAETPSSRSWVGRVAGRADSQITLVWGDGVLVGHLWIGGEAFRIRYVAGGTHLIEELDPAAFPTEDEPIEVPASGAAPVAESEVGALADSGSTFDVLVVYTAAARTAAGGTTAMQNEIAAAITDTNTAYANSGIIPRARLVAAVEVSYTETGNSSTDLIRLQNPLDGYMDTVHALREVYRADIVALLVANAGAGNCGVAYLMSGNDPNFASKAFSVTDRDCHFQYTMTHEMGHNMGSNHAPEDPTGSGAFSYSYGYKDPTHAFRTVMAYDCPPAYNCTRVRHFSNPSVTYNGWTTGTATQNNALSINNVRTTVANWRDSTSACSQGTQNLCLQSSRFDANVIWRDTSNGSEGIANAITYSGDGGFFWFFSSGNIETGVKVLDGRPVNGKFWVFHGSLTTMEYTLRVRDTVAGTVKAYVKPSGSFCGSGDTSAFTTTPGDPILIEGGMSFEGDSAPSGPVSLAGSCVSNSTTVCLLANRFQVRVKKAGVYQGGLAVTGESGVFWFDGSTSNPEVIVKTLDGTGVNGKYWVFYGSLTSQSYQVEVTDTNTFVTKTYTPPAAHCGQGDTAAF